MSKSQKLLIAAILLAAMPASYADVFEDWASPQVSIGGEFGWPTTFNIWNYSKRWVYNNWDAGCNAYLEGPNRCYATSGNKLYMHAEKGPNGDGFLLASLNSIYFPTGIIAEVEVHPWCTNVSGAGPSGCGWNLGIWENEKNYRSAGITFDLSAQRAYFNIWGPCYEAHFDGIQHPTTQLSNGLYDICPPQMTPTLHTNIPTPLGNTYVLRIQYWNSSSGWRWDYFLNGTWVAGHPANPDNDYKMGPAYFPYRTARLQIAAFSYSQRPSWWSGPYNAAEGYWGPVRYWTF